MTNIPGCSSEHQTLLRRTFRLTPNCIRGMLGLDGDEVVASARALPGGHIEIVMETQSPPLGEGVTPAEVSWGQVGETVALTVVEALYEDVNWGRVRVDAPTRVALGLSPGDVVEIRGEKTTAAIVWRSPPEDDGKGIVHLDGLERANAGAVPGQTVIIHRVVPSQARSVTLLPDVPGMWHFDSNAEILAKRSFYKRPLVEGDLVSASQVTQFGTPLRFKVVKTEPPGIVLVGEETKFILLTGAESK